MCKAILGQDTWLAYQLIEAYPESDAVAGTKTVNQPLFDSVIVVTDRRLLDKQLRDNIKDFSEVKNIVAPTKCNFSDAKILFAVSNFIFAVDSFINAVAKI